MNKYRFKTQDEFIRDGQWEDDNHCPEGWHVDGDMNHYLGQDIPEGANESCDLAEGFYDDGWSFEHTNYVLKEEDYTGKYIKALVDNPQCTGIKAGEIIKIISKLNTYRLDKTFHGCVGMGIQCPLKTSEWELVEEPKQNSKVVPGYVRCVHSLMNAKVGKIYPVVDETHCLCEQNNTYNWKGIEFTPATKQEYDAQFSDEQDPLYICRQEYRKGMKVRSACKTGCYSGEFIIEEDPSEFRNLSGNTEIVDYSCSKGYLYFKGQYAEILEEAPTKIPWATTTEDSMIGTIGIGEYLIDSGFAKSNPEAYNWLMKPSIETVHSVSVKLRTKKQINKHLKF